MMAVLQIVCDVYYHSSVVPQLTEVYPDGATGLQIFQRVKGILFFSFCCGLQNFEIDMVKTIVYIISASFNNGLLAGVFWRFETRIIIVFC